MVNIYYSALYLYHNRKLHICTITYIISFFTLASYTLSHIATAPPALFSRNGNFYFSESWQCSNKNRTQIEYGRMHLSESKIIICGLIRDRESHIERLKQQLSQITNLFADYAVIIVENDSKDGTRQKVIKWAQSDEHIHVIGCENQINSLSPCNLSLTATTIKFLPDLPRIEKMVRLRNIYLNYIEQHSVLRKFDYVIVEDFDLTAYTYLNGLFSTGFYLKSDPAIDAICSNGILLNQRFGGMVKYETYFDPYAHKDQQSQNWSTAYKNIWSTLFRKYSCHEGLIRVLSCFSGRTIYRYKSIASKRYRTYLDQYKQPICEHVGLHETLDKIYLNAEMIFYVTKNNIRK